MGVFRFGFLDSVLSRPLLSGFINAVAVTIVIEQVHALLSLARTHAQKMVTFLTLCSLQIDTLLGIPNPAAHDWHKLIHVFNNVSDVVWQSAVVGMFTPAHRAHYYRRLIAACVCRCERDHSPLRIQDCQQADQPIGDH